MPKIVIHANTEKEVLDALDVLEYVEQMVKRYNMTHDGNAELVSFARFPIGCLDPVEITS